MKKLILILACVSICATSCKQKTTQQEEQPQIEANNDIEADEAMLSCQSCGMPMSEEFFGTNEDGTANDEYCSYCYVDGKFTAPEMTMNDMIDLCIPHMVEQGWVEEEARTLLEEVLPQLKRWQVQE